MNTLEQEVGFYSVIDPFIFTEDRIVSRQVMIISKSVVESISSDTRDDIRKFDPQGGILILEYPADCLQSSIRS